MHINSTIGLIKPGITLDDGSQWHASKGQRFLWRSWLEFWDAVARAAKANQADVYAVFNGDLVDVNGKHQQSQTVSLHRGDVIKMAFEALEPALAVSQYNFVIRGTSAHVGSSGEMEEIIGMDIGAEQPEKGKHSFWELMLDVNDVRFDIRHHGPLGRLRHTRANALNRRATELVDLYAGQRLRVPNIGLQSHNHHFSTSSDEYLIKVFALPAFQLLTEHAIRIGIIELADIGGIIFKCQDGQWDPDVKKYDPPKMKPWSKQNG